MYLYAIFFLLLAVSPIRGMEGPSERDKFSKAFDDLMNNGTYSTAMMLQGMEESLVGFDASLETEIGELDKLIKQARSVPGLASPEIIKEMALRQGDIGALLATISASRSSLGSGRRLSPRGPDITEGGSISLAAFLSDGHEKRGQSVAGVLDEYMRRSLKQEAAHSEGLDKETDFDDDGGSTFRTYSGIELPRFHAVQDEWQGTTRDTTNESLERHSYDDPSGKEKGKEKEE